MRKLPQRDPSAAYQRKVTSERRVGAGARCACGETRPEALVPNRVPVICSACDRAMLGKTAVDHHHVAGGANSSITIPVPVNDHRAILSVDQYDWPEPTLENSSGSPLLARAACIRGFTDTSLYLIEKLVLPHAEFCELMDAFLTEKFGPKWWRNTEMEQFIPKE